MITIETFNKEGCAIANEIAMNEQHGLMLIGQRIRLGFGVSVNGQDCVTLSDGFYAVQKAIAEETIQ